MRACVGASAMDAHGRTDLEGADWDDSATTALLPEREPQDAGDGEMPDPGDASSLGSALQEVSKAWRKRTQAQRLSAQRWIEQETHVPRRARWREELAEALEATWTHVAIVVLLLVDLAATAIDILKTMHNKSHDLDVCVDLVESCQGCIGHFEHSAEWKWTYWTSIVILVILMLNVLGLIVAFGRSFFLHPLYVLDLVVVSTALGLEVLLDADTAGLIIILTLWRIVRVAHGIFEVTDEAWEKSIRELETQVKGVQDAYERAQEALQEKNRELGEKDGRIAELEARLESGSTPF